MSNYYALIIKSPYLLLSNHDLMIRVKEICSKEVKRFDKMIIQTLKKKKLILNKLSQPNNNHNPNHKTTITVVGMRLSNRWEPPPPTTTTTQTQNYMIEQKQSNTLKTKVIGLYKETPKQFLNPTPTPKIAHQGPKKSK